MDKNEFMEGMIISGFDVSEVEVVLIWPMLVGMVDDEDESDDEITSADFKLFIQ